MLQTEKLLVKGYHGHEDRRNEVIAQCLYPAVEALRRAAPSTCCFGVLTFGRLVRTGRQKRKSFCKMAFNVTTEELSKWVRECFENSLVGQIKATVIPSLEKLGGQEGLIKSLNTDTNLGIRDLEVETRRTVFGSNYVEPEPPTSIWELAWDALQDPCLIFLCFAAVVSILVGLIFNEGMEWLEGIAIMSAVLVVVTVSAVNDYQKDQQFRALNAAKVDISVFVIRGGEKKKISTHDVVVGDVVLLSTGDMVVADGVVFDKNDLGISEAMLTGESVIKRKGPFSFGHDDAPDKPVAVAPTVYAGTFVQEGEGRMVVLAVGRNTYQARERALAR